MKRKIAVLSADGTDTWTTEGGGGVPEVEMTLKRKKSTITHRVVFESAAGEERVVEVEATTEEEALEAATTQYDPLHLARSQRVVHEETIKGSFLNRNFVIKP